MSDDVLLSTATSNASAGASINSHANTNAPHVYSPALSAAGSSSLSSPQSLSSSSETRPSSSRVINPAPIATAPSPLQLDHGHLGHHGPAMPSQLSPVGGGPTSASYVVPPRPKPGRKPATDEPASKRKAQNRESQRAFRARKAAKLTEMQTQVEIAEQRHKQEMHDKNTEMAAKDLRIAQLDALVAQLEDAARSTAQERDFWKDKALELEVVVKQIKESTSSSPAKETEPEPTPNGSVSLFTEREIDFTARFATRRARTDTRPSIAFMTQSNEDDSKCGFCTDESNCLCRDTSLQDIQRSQEELAAPVLAWDASALNGIPSSPADRAATGAGTCADCMRDPKQRAWCQRVAQLKTPADDFFAPSPISRNSSISSEPDPMGLRTNYAPVPDNSLPNRHSIGCKDAYRLFDGRVPTDRDGMDWSALRPTPAPTGREGFLGLKLSREYSALELDTAGVIATLQQTMGPLTPRKEDGPHATLVRIAQEYRRSSQSPRV